MFQKRMRLFLILICVSACGNNPPYDGGSQMRKAQKSMSFKSFAHHLGGRNVFGVRSGEACKPAVLFIHGAPGDWQAWGRYLGDQALLDEVFMIAVDRPGYGQSKTENTQNVALHEQSSLIMRAVLKEHKGPFLVVGHSYGGPVQVRMALEYPEQVDGMLILAGALDPELHRPRFYHRVAQTWAVGPFLSAPFRVANNEMMALDKDLARDIVRLEGIKTPITVIQGGRDWLVPPKNVNFIKDTFTGADVRLIFLEKEGHFIPWQQYGLVRDQILAMAGAMKMKNACDQK